MTTAKDYVNRLGGTAAIDDGGVTLANDLHKQVVVVTGLEFTADDNTQRQVLWKNATAHAYRLISAEFVPEAAVTADNTNYSTVAIAHQAAPAAALGDVAASMQTSIAAGTGNWVANTPEALTLSATEADKVIAAGEYAVLELDGTEGTGVNLPVGVWVLVYEVK